MPTKDSLKVLTGKGEDQIKVSDARWFTAFAAVATCVGTSMITRVRAAEGKAPMAKVFF